MSDKRRHLPSNCWCGHEEEDHYERTGVFAQDAAVLYGCHECDTAPARNVAEK
jgi:hypothetical protein